MATYQQGQTYEFDVVEIRKDFGNNDYMAISDGEREYRLYDIFLGQYESLPKKVWVRVTQVDVLGKIKLKQDVERFNRNHYTEGSMKIFRVTEVREDKNKKSYYRLVDDLAEHSMYFMGDQKHQVGDDVVLDIVGFNDKGFLKLREHSSTMPTNPPVAATATTMTTVAAIQSAPAPAAVSKLPVLNLPDESQTLELKSSIVFPAGSRGVPDLKSQIFVIVKEMTAFMNAEGGDLYIGVRDRTNEVVGIAGDYPHLESDESDDGTYKADRDGFELKIRNSLDKMCQSVANSLISVEFNSIDNREYCVIHVSPAKRPILVNGTFLYQRVGNRVQQLRGDDINYFIADRMTLSLKSIVDTSDAPQALSHDELKKVFQELLNERRMLPTGDVPKPVPLDQVDYWIVWFNDGTWVRQRKKSEDQNVHLQVPVPVKISSPMVVWCYESGRVNVSKLSDVKKKVNLNVLQTRNGWSKTGEKPKAIFIAQPTDYIVGYSIDSNHIESVKLLSVSDYTPTANGSNQGGPFAPDNCKMTAFAIIGAEHKAKVPHLIGTKQRRSTDAGIPLNSPAHESEIRYLKQLLTK